MSDRRPRSARSPTRLAWGVALLLALARPAAAGRAGARPVEWEARLEGLGIARLDRGSQRQRPFALLSLAATQRLTRRLRWRLSTTGRWGGPPENGAGPGAFGFTHSFQNFSPSLEAGEAYLAYRRGRHEVRVGMQRFFWGVLDVASPNDLLSPRQYEDPFLDREEDRKIAVPAVSIDLGLPAGALAEWLEELRLSVVWEPIAVPWRYPLPGERWFAPAAVARPRLDLGARPGTPCPCEVQVEQRARNAEPPARRFENGNVGIRLGGRTGIVDWTLSYFEGFDPEPAFRVPIEVRIDDATADPVQVTARTELLPAYERFRSLGGSAAWTLGDFALRAEGAYWFRRPFSMAVSRLTDEVVSDPDLLARLVAGERVELPAFARRDAVAWGVGVDTVIGEAVPILELDQWILLHNDRRLLVRNVDTRISGRLENRWPEWRVKGEVEVSWGIESGYAMVRSQLSRMWLDGLETTAGVLGIFGETESLVGQFRRNDELYVRIRYTL